MIPFVLGYTIGTDAKMWGKPDQDRPCVTFVPSEAPSQTCYPIEFFQCLASKEEQPDRETGLSHSALEFLSGGHGDLNWQKKNVQGHRKIPVGDPIQVKMIKELSRGRTSMVWSAEPCPALGAPFPLILKIVSYRFLPSVIKETLFYKNYLPSVNLPSIKLARYVGTYGIPDGGWYVLLLEDVGRQLGKTVEWGDIDEEEEEAIWLDDKQDANKPPSLKTLEQTFEKELEKADIFHPNISPRNVLRAYDSNDCYLVNFGDAVLEKEPFSSSRTYQILFL
ncbi:hypothetical protein T439DRAFT_379271 [Meredithblackwellia eburnea MCA 4105]